jgi:hypothetical protein
LDEESGQKKMANIKNILSIIADGFTKTADHPATTIMIDRKLSAGFIK